MTDFRSIGKGDLNVQGMERLKDGSFSYSKHTSPQGPREDSWRRFAGEGEDQAVYYRRGSRLGPDKYKRQPFNIVRYDDLSGEYIEPSLRAACRLYLGGREHDGDDPEELILDTPRAVHGVTEIR